MTHFFICLCEGSEATKQTPGRVNFRTLLSPIVGVADTSPEGGSKKYVILSVSEISHDQSEKYMPRQFFDGILHFCYSALNAGALKLSFSAFFIKNASAL